MKLNNFSFKGFLSNFWQEILLIIGFIFYVIYFTTATFLKYVNYYMGRFDLGNMDQTVWNTLHGNVFMLTDPNGTKEISRLAVHADFILIFLAPFYIFWENPRMLLLIQTLILACGGIFVYLISRKVLENKIISLFFAFCFFLNPAVQYTNLFDFHAVTLATTFLLGSFYFILVKKWWLVLVFLFLAGITKEQVWAINAIFGIYIFLFHKQKILGSFIFIFSTIIFILLFWYLIPSAASGEHFAIEFYSQFGISPGEVIKNLLLNPVQAVQVMTSPDRIDYIRQLFIPLGYFSFLAFPFLIFATPDILINLLSSSPQMHQIYYQYSATITPFIFISAIFGVKFLIKKIPEIPYSGVAIMILIFTLISSYLYGPMFFAKKPQDAWYKKQLENRKIIYDFLDSIPKDVKISATNNLGSQLSQRKTIYIIPNGIENSEYVLFLLRNKTEIELNAFENIKRNPRFYLYYNDRDFYVFKIKSSESLSEIR